MWEKFPTVGTEYRLSFTCTDLPALSARLQRLRGASVTTDGIEVRRAATGAMPDATITLDSDGLYFCDFGGSGREVLGDAIAALLGHVDSVRIALLEP